MLSYAKKHIVMLGKHLVASHHLCTSTLHVALCITSTAGNHAVHLQREYGYPVPVAQLGCRSLALLVDELRAEVITLATPEGKAFLFPPKKGAKNAFNQVRRFTAAHPNAGPFRTSS